MRIAHVVVMAALLAGFSAGPVAAQAPLAAAPTAGFETKRPVADARDCIAIVFGAIAREGQDVHWMGNSPQPMLWVTDNHTLLASVRVEEISGGSRVEYRTERQPQARQFEQALLTCG